MLKVVLYGDAPVVGGGERYLELLAANVDRAVVEPRVVLSTEPALDDLAGSLLARGIVVDRLPAMTTLSNPGAFLRVFGALAWRRPDLLHFNLVDPRACNAAIVAAATAGHRAMLATEHLPHSPFDSKPTPLRHRLASALLRRRIALNEAGKEALLKRGVRAETIDVVRNGVVDPGAPSSADRAAARAAVAPDATGPIVGFVGRLEAQKRPDVFLDAARGIAAARRDATFAMVGDGSMREAIEARVRSDETLRPRVRLLGRRADVLSLYPGFDALIVTSSYEGQPLVVIEAGLRATPVVAGRIEGMDETIADRETGRLVPEGDADAYAAATLEILSAPDRSASMGAAARLRMLALHSVESMVEGTLAAYRKLLPRRR
jgi:glycosyltransferase involved in cell wall biosynthesis